MADTSLVRPRLAVLSPGQMELVHDTSLRILSGVGLRIDSERARQALARKFGASVVAGDRVHLPAEAVDWALRAAPAEIEVFDRLGRPALRLGRRQHFGIGVTNLYYQDPETDQVTPFTRRHMADSMRLGNALPYYEVISTVGIVQDVPPQVSDLYATLDMAAHTVKPLIILVSDEPSFPRVLDLIETLHGDLAARPFVIPYLNPISPLVINAGTADKLFTTLERGLPVIYSNYGMAGASTPITPAGTLALMNAELLAGLVLSQTIREGAPVVLGSLPAFFDMKGMGSFYEPRSMTINLACAEMMAHYGLPHCGSSGSGNGWGPDLVAAGMFWLNHLTSCIGQVGLVPFVGGNLGSLVFSPATAVLAHEIIDAALRFAAGFSLDEDSLAMQDIAHVGPGGDYLTSPLTLGLFRQSTWRSDVFPLLSLEAWQARGSPQATDLLRRHTVHLIENATIPDDRDELIERGEAFIRTHAIG